MKTERKQKLIMRLVMIALIGSAIIAVSLTITGGVLIDRAYGIMVREELKATAELLSDTYKYAYTGDWAMDARENLTKGDVVISDDLIDDVKAKTGVDFTFFYGPERVLTSITEEGSSRKLVGSTAAPDVVTRVINSGEESYERGEDLGGRRYDAYYIPVRNSDGNIVGMIAAERDTATISTTVRRAVLTMIGVGILVFLVIVGVGLFYGKTTSPVIHGITEELKRLASGNLNIHIDPEYLKRKDELGNISECVQLLDEKLGNVINRSRQMAESIHDSGTQLSTSAEQASVASKQVTEAIDEISRGAVNQAESVQDAAGNTTDIGMDVETISDNVEQLGAYSGEMHDACDRAMEALNALISQSDDVQTSVNEIGNTIGSTNESARTIAEFSEAISQLASQTNLLSLNASIEAARAGEAGKGFAVVASEIGQLAVQSSDSAERIGVIVEKLLKDSEESVEVMKKLNESFAEQARHLDSTKSEMESMVYNVENVAVSSANIETKVKRLGSTKNNLGSIVSDLSAASEENAASTEETNSSMEELNATFALINESAAGLQRLAEEMAEAIGYFRNE